MTKSLGDVVVVRFDSLAGLVHDKQALSNATLFLDDFPMRGLHPVAISYASNSLRFEVLRRDKTNSDQWMSLFKSTAGWQPAVTPSVGFEDDLEHVTSASSGSFYFREYSSAGWTAGAVAVVAFAFLLLMVYGAKSNLLREITPFKEKDFKLKPIPLLTWLPGLGKVRATGRERPPFSLGRVQMAIWFLVIFVCYVFLWLVLDERNSFNATALTLLGITTTTGLISRAIDVSKRDGVSELQAEQSQLDARQTELEAKPHALSDSLKAELMTVKARSAEASKKITEATIPADEHTSEGFFTDILSDENGISLQRLQFLGWTLVLCLVFVAGVLNNYAMPDFDNTLLGLMGVSSGAFLGFSFPRRTACQHLSPDPARSKHASQLVHHDFRHDADLVPRSACGRAARPWREGRTDSSA